MREIRVGVLALQGDFREHIAMLDSISGVHSPVSGREVRGVGELDGIDALIVPGGESTTIGRLARIYGLVAPLQDQIRAGLPTLGTCAGMVFLGMSTTGTDQPQLQVLDVEVERNAFGRQIDSFEVELPVVGTDEPMPAVFIRAPWICRRGVNVEVLASVENSVLYLCGRETSLRLRSILNSQKIRAFMNCW